MPTALAVPWPSGPVVASTPGVRCGSGWPGRPAAPLAERLEVVERQVVAGQVQQAVEQRAAVAGRQDEAVAVGPVRIARDCASGSAARARRPSAPRPAAGPGGRSWPSAPRRSRACGSCRHRVRRCASGTVLKALLPLSAPSSRGRRRDMDLITRRGFAARRRAGSGALSRPANLYRESRRLLDGQKTRRHR